MVTRKKQTVAVDTDKINQYEMVYIINPNVPEEDLEGVIDRLSQFITSKGGEVSEVDKWGRRRLAYPIKHLLEGYYVLIRFTMNPAWSSDLEASILISDDILRHLLVNTNE